MYHYKERWGQWLWTADSRGKVAYRAFVRKKSIFPKTPFYPPILSPQASRQSTSIPSSFQRKKEKYPKKFLHYELWKNRSFTSSSSFSFTLFSRCLEKRSRWKNMTVQVISLSRRMIFIIQILNNSEDLFLLYYQYYEKSLLLYLRE